MASSPYGGGGFGYQQPGGLGGGTPLGGGAPGSLLGGDRYGGTPLTGGHGAMGSGNRYGGSLLAGDRAGGYQSSGLGAGGLMGSAGGHNQHGGSYGDLGGAPGSGIARSQQPFAPMLFSSPGGSALGGRVGAGYDPSALGFTRAWRTRRRRERRSRRLRRSTRVDRGILHLRRRERWCRSHARLARTGPARIILRRRRADPDDERRQARLRRRRERRRAAHIGRRPRDAQHGRIPPRWIEDAGLRARGNPVGGQERNRRRRRRGC